MPSASRASRTPPSVGQSKFSKPTSRADLLAQFPLCEPYERAVDSLGADRLCAQADAGVVAAAGVGADADQVEADLDRLDGLERLEDADAAVVECRVGEPVRGRQWLAARFLE